MAASDMNASLQTHSKTRSFCALSEMQVGDNSSHVVIPTPTLTFDLVNPKSIGFDVVSTTTTVPTFKSFRSGVFVLSC